MPLHHLHEQYTHSSKLSDVVHLFWTLASTSTTPSSSEQTDEDRGDFNEIQFAIAYNLPDLALHDRNNNNEDDEHLLKPHHEHTDNLHEEDDVEEDANEQSNNYWLAFGISPQGGMIGADFMIYLPRRHTRRKQQEPLLLDAHGIQYSFPIVDSCGQDWTLLNSSIIHDEDCIQFEGCNYTTHNNTEFDTTSWHILHVKRALHSNDVNEDVPFLNDSSVLLTNPTFVLAAWGELKNGDERESDGRRRRIKRSRSLIETASARDDDINSMDLTSILLPHGPLQRVSTTVRFFDESQPDDDGKGITNDGNNDDSMTTATQAFHNMPYIDLIPKEPFLIPSAETTYKNFCFAITEYPQLTKILNNQKDDKTVHIIGFQNIIQTGSPVHHMDLHGTRNSVLSSDTRLCRVYMDLIHPWEAGSPKEFALPMEAGIPLGYDNDKVTNRGSSSTGGGYKAFRLEVHYHNPHRRDGMLDQSGVRIYYSIEKRENVAGLMLLGDYMLKLRGSYTVGGTSADKDTANSTTVVSTDNKEAGYGMKHSFYCPSSCFSKERLGQNKNVTVFREVLHMHKSGERMTNIHLDSNGNILHASEANYFDFSRGAGYGSRVNLPYQINEGDSFVTSCYFAKRGTTWGSSSEDEMCQTFMWYYPQEDYSLTCGYADARARKANDTLDPLGCEVSYDRNQVSFDMERLQPNDQCQAAEASKRPVKTFDSTVDTRQKWPSLVQLIESWKQSRIPVDPKTNSTKPSSITQAKSTQSTLQEDCQLCSNGQRPTHPNTVIEGYSWTCDELDAAIPVLYTEPELLFFSIFDVPPCEQYNSAFGNLCCSSTNNDEGGELVLQRGYSLAILLVASSITLVMMLLKRRRAQPVGAPVLEITSSPLA